MKTFFNIEDIYKSNLCEFVIYKNISDCDLNTLVTSLLSLKPLPIIIYTDRIRVLKKTFKNCISLSKTSVLKTHDSKLFLVRYKSLHNLTFKDMHGFLQLNNLNEILIIDDLCDLPYTSSIKYLGTHNKKYKKMFFGCALKYLIISPSVDIKKLLNIVELAETESYSNDEHFTPKHGSWDSTILNVLHSNNVKLNTKKILLECKKNSKFESSHPLANTKTCATQLLRLFRLSIIKRAKVNNVIVYFV